MPDKLRFSVLLIAVKIDNEVVIEILLQYDDVKASMKNIQKHTTVCQNGKMTYHFTIQISMKLLKLFRKIS